ncbi:disks large homolog 2-like isoform X1 [Cydia pomonella]|uniref:disks large homolog 2-like isoform X1 n=1 Tax=Cydia pomonella TaxID=82600 RepID=UPI002ADE92C0|nr:disks large homolog 2-like isoform X1 [Cydia pomonella]XP_061711098.1 disks large homolog 2-like isoform X1 [Cydia pomonella]XP_061711099.1 disks large homolog 2-like isoform X1 [Cydia pomonella]XP_061711100.1 disks large homolog 2-like isoform X1 [Cydia pomonella]XP_061711101.1 disks large homolog 2-like isoform X1 [Cydia pomonella]XP_061711102.1 disks large homolog 2-like isoform X1 [Cydia pomonella]XP_061711103.1 disks large homolog 2-like isoform X1 [Cydia pomonella]XP_061711104.1 dis
MTTWMALFGLVWLLRVRGSLCGCAACKRARHEHDTQPGPRTPSPDERAPFDVITLQHYTRDVTVQTDFDDEDDLDKIELQITEESNVGNFEGGREQPAQSPESARRGPGSYQPSDSDNESVWETSDVTLERGAGGLGLSIAGGETGGDVSITRIAEHGAARKDGRLQIGDVLLQVNDVSVENAPHSVAVDALQKAGNVVRLRVRRARRPRVVTLWRGARGLGLGIAGGADDAAGGGGVFVSHIAVGGAAHHDGRLRLGDKILAVRDEDGIETSLIGATHAQAVTALRSTGEQVTLVVLPAGSFPPVARTAPLYSTKTQATSCSTLHELLEEEPSEIPRCVRMVRLVRSGSRLGMDIVGGLGGEADTASGVEDDACGVFVSGVSVGGAAYGMLHRGDRILSVDGRDLTRATHEQAAAALKQYSGAAVSIAAQYQPEQYERLRARIRAINAAAAASPHSHRHATHVPVHPDLHAVYPR